MSEATSVYVGTGGRSDGRTDVEIHDTKVGPYVTAHVCVNAHVATHVSLCLSG